MIRHGQAPFLECSSQGDKRFSAFYAKPKSLGGKSIEDAYQRMKVIDVGRGEGGEGGARLQTGLGWREAKGKPAVNIEDCQTAYKQWWREWVEEQGLIGVLLKVVGVSDLFGQVGHVCQASVLWELRAEALAKLASGGQR